MTLGRHIRLAGAIMCIAGAVTTTLSLSLLGLLAMFLGVLMQVDNLEQRIEALEPKGDHDEEA